MYPEYALLSRHERGGLVEEEHHGIILQCSKSAVFKKTGNDNNYPFYLRSCMKPIQFVAMMDICSEFDFTPAEIALCSGSHCGEDFHIDTVLKILKKIGLSEKDLLCPPQFPLSSKVRRKCENPKKIYNNCSGKHAAMLAYCVLKGYDIENYNDKNHPLQQHILNFTAELCNIELKNCPITNDGCTVPVIAMPLENIAKGFLNIFTDKKYELITSSILNNPYHFGGDKRIDSELIASSGKKLIAKAGAGNICCVVNLVSQTALVIKLSDSDNFARGFILSELFKKSGMIDDSSRLDAIFPSEISDENGTVLGEIKLCFDF